MERASLARSLLAASLTRRASIQPCGEPRLVPTRDLLFQAVGGSRDPCFDSARPSARCGRRSCAR